MYLIKFTLKTESNCLIGNQTTPFSAGGVDQSTLVDNEGYPIISGSAFKGALRNIYRENISLFPKTNEYVQEVLTEILSRYRDFIKNFNDGNEMNQDKIEQLENIEEEIGKKKALPEYIFGIERLNNTPKLCFSDIKVKDRGKDKRDYLVVDMKNTIDEKDNKLESRPRTYKCIRPGVEFMGEIRFNDNGFRSNKLENLEKEMLEEVQKALLMFNGGFYGIGNSKSRGYGNITISDNK